MDIEHGILCLTFDDRNFDGWVSALPIFEKYHAHATFFVSGDMDEVAFATIKKLHDAGHSIGLHTLNHTDAPAYFEENGAGMYFETEIKKPLQTLAAHGIAVTSFAYPNNKRTEETDAFLRKYFRRFRAGLKSMPEKYVPVAKVAEKTVLGGSGIGEYYDTKEETVLEEITFAAKENALVLYFSHNIEENATFINMPTKLLENCLAAAEALGVKALGFDELP